MFVKNSPFQHRELMISHLSVGGLHMRHIGVPLRKPLETLPTCPAGGLHTGPAVLLSLFPGTTAVFNRDVPLLLLDGMNILVPFPAVFLDIAAFCLCCCVSYMNTLPKKSQPVTTPCIHGDHVLQVIVYRLFIIYSQHQQVRSLPIDKYA